MKGSGNMVSDDLEKARKNRERVAEMREREAHNEKPLPAPIYTEPAPVSVSLQHGNPHSGARHQGKERQPDKPSPTPLENYEPGCTRDEFFSLLKKASKPIKQPMSDQRPSATLDFALGLLKDDVEEAFTTEWGKLARKYNEPEGDEVDSYFETLASRNLLSNLAKMLQHWIKYIEALPDCQHTRGAIKALRTLNELALDIGKMCPFEEDTNDKR